MSGRTRLERLARGADEIAEDGDVGAIGADAAGVNGKTEALGEIEINAGVIEFGKTETLRGQNAVQARGIDRARRTMALPGTASQLIKLLPIAFVPRGHRLLCYVLFFRLDARSGKKVRHGFFRHRSTHPQPRKISDSSLGRRGARRSRYFTLGAVRHIPCLLFQTRYRVICFARRPTARREGDSAMNGAGDSR